jgi:hypothetical protein
MSIVKRLVSGLVVAAHVSACATGSKLVPEVPGTQRDGLGVIGVVSLNRATESELQAGAGGQGGLAEGAKAGAAAGVGGFRNSLGVSSCSDLAGCGLIVLLLPIFVVGGAIVGAVAGTVQGQPDERVGYIGAQLQAAVTEVGQREALQTEVLGAAARSGIAGMTGISSSTVSSAKVDTVLEVGLVRVALVGRGGEDPELTLRVHAVARLLEARTRTELHRDYTFTYAAAPRRLNEWSADQARLLEHELGRACRSLGQSIVDRVLLVEPARPTGDPL